jgi:hypothetical protein
LFPRHWESIFAVLDDYLDCHGEPMSPPARVHRIQEAAP